MLRLWRCRQGMMPLRDDTGDGAVRTEGLDFTSRLLAEMDLWYVTQLARAPVELLASDDYHHLTATAGEGGLTVKLPEGTFRVARVRLSGWKGTPALTDDPDSPLARCQRHELTGACAEAPVAVLDRAAGELRLYPGGDGDTLAELRLVVRQPDVYAFDRALLCSCGDGDDC